MLGSDNLKQLVYPKCLCRNPWRPVAFMVVDNLTSVKKSLREIKQKNLTRAVFSTGEVA